MREEIVIGGFGGQGVILAGNLLAWAAMQSGYEVTAMFSYGAEMRGGTANTSVIISSDPVGSPVVLNPTMALLMNDGSIEKYIPQMKPGALCLINSSVCRAAPSGNGLRYIFIPANELASRAGEVKSANIVMLGCLLAAAGVAEIKNMEQAVEIYFKKKKNDLIKFNLAALAAGFSYKL
ncbi:MAG: hypothetical protein A2096_03130 [Spirochaetes bacterium GWF1_41_5]|nr:MAG: hypothetical protein A2096_03130 [Spirochaetes bacterium GWF1_41_5]HBE01265.1 2-oxoacid:ferredoxin oxidoreductase subunit gamma [Spirochaetia bacterium]